MDIIKRYSSLFLLIVLIGGYSGYSSAEDYYWRTNDQLTNSIKFPSPEAACRGLDRTQSNGTTYVFVRVTIASSGVSATCYHQRINSDGTIGSTTNWFSNLTRIGTGCTAPAVYNSETGACETQPDKCESTKGQQVEHEYNAGPISQAVPNAPDSTICDNSCQYSRTATVKGCARFLDNDDGTIDLDAVYCTVMYEGTGQSCTSGNPAPGSVFDQPPSSPPADKTPKYMKDEGCSEWTAASSGGSMSGSMTMNCTQTTEYKQPGNVDCSSGTCKASTPTPEYSKTEVSADTTKTTNSDGSTSTTTTTDTSTTKCKGLASCNSTSKSETEEETTDADGNTDSTSSVCTGEGCNPDEEEEDSSSGDESEEEEEEGDTGKVSGESCSDTLSCEGDVIQCAILRKQKEQACAWEYDDVKADIQSAVEGEGYQLGEDSISLGDSFSEGSGASRWLSSGCPSSRSVSVMGHSYSLSWEPVCDFSRSLSYVIVAMAGVFFAVYVGRGLGGQ